MSKWELVKQIAIIEKGNCSLEMAMSQAHIWEINIWHTLSFAFVWKAGLYSLLFSSIPQSLLLYSCQPLRCLGSAEGEAQIQSENSYLEIKFIASWYADKISLIKTLPATWAGQRQPGLSMWAHCQRGGQYALLQTVINHEGGCEDHQIGIKCHEL